MPDTSPVDRAAPGPTPEPLKVIVADDDPLARRVVRDALQRAGVVVIAEAANGREAVELARHYRPDIVLMDLAMPDVDGLEATRQLTRTAPEIAVVVLTAAGDSDTGMLSLRAGAAGFLSKELDVDALPRILHGVRDGQAAISRELTMALIGRFQRIRVDGTGLRPVQSVLSGREWEVLDRLCSGASTDDIAEALVLSPETVRSHVKNLLRKLDVRSREEAIAVARRMRQDAADRQLVA